MSQTGNEGGAQVLVVGSGKLAGELIENLTSTSIDCVLPWSLRHTAGDGEKIVVHAGSGREIGEVLFFCARHRSVLLELSTTNSLEGVDPAFPVIICPNTNILMLKFMAMLQSQGDLFANYEKGILESHQSDKKSEAGTAIRMAKSLGIPINEIVSVRDPLVQQIQIGIPPEHLGRHAYHRIVISDGNVGIVFEAKVLGKAPYAHGLARILEGIHKKDLAPGKVDVVDLVRKGWI